MTLQIDLGFDGAAVAKREVARDRGHRVQVDVLPHPRAEQLGVPAHESCTGDEPGICLVGESLGKPQAQMHLATSRVLAGGDSPEEDPGDECAECETSGSEHEQQPQEGKRPPRHQGHDLGR